MSDRSPSRPSSPYKTVNCVLYPNGFLESKNNRIKVIKRVAYGYRNVANFRQRILLTNGRGLYAKAA
jgi:endonuclease III-like uncharacterized protein